MTDVRPLGALCRYPGRVRCGIGWTRNGPETYQQYAEQDEVSHIEPP